MALSFPQVIKKKLFREKQVVGRLIEYLITQESQQVAVMQRRTSGQLELHKFPWYLVLVSFLVDLVMVGVAASERRDCLTFKQSH